MAPDKVDTYQVTASLMYRKVDQFLINFLLGEDSGLTAPIIEMNRTTVTVEVLDRVTDGRRPDEGAVIEMAAGG